MTLTKTEPPRIRVLKMHMRRVSTTPRRMKLIATKMRRPC